MKGRAPSGAKTTKTKAGNLELQGELKDTLKRWLAQPRPKPSQDLGELEGWYRSPKHGPSALFHSLLIFLILSL